MDRSRPQFSVLGLPVHILDDYAGWLIERLHQGLGSHVVTLNAEMAMQAEQNPSLAGIIREAELVIPDGSGVVLYLRLRGKPAQRYPGIELAESLLEAAGKLPNSEPIFFFGGSPELRAQRQKLGSNGFRDCRSFLSTAISRPMQKKTCIKASKKCSQNSFLWAWECRAKSFGLPNTDTFVLSLFGWELVAVSIFGRVQKLARQLGFATII